MALENITLVYNDTDHQIVDEDNVAITPRSSSSVSFSEDEVEEWDDVENWTPAGQYDYLTVDLTGNIAVISTTEDTIDLFIDSEDPAEQKVVWIKIEDSTTSTIYSGKVTIMESTL